MVDKNKLLLISFGILLVISLSFVLGYNSYVKTHLGSINSTTDLGSTAWMTSAQVYNDTWLNFDGVNDYINTSNKIINFNSNVSNFSICTNISFYGTSAEQVILDQRNSANSGWTFGFNSGNSIYFKINASNIAQIVINDNKTHSVCIVVDRLGLGSFYVDNKKSFLFLNTTSFSLIGNQYLTIGVKAYTSGAYLNSSLYSISIYNSNIANTTISYPTDNSNQDLNFTTYELSNQTIHPSIIYFNNSWNGYNYWMANTPLPKGDESKENPSIFVCNSSLYSCNSKDAVWESPIGLTNPINKSSCLTFCSDVDIVYNNDTNYIYAYYRKWNGTTAFNISYEIVQNSSNGINWSEEKILSTQIKNLTSDIDRSCSYLYRNNLWERFCQNGNFDYKLVYYNSTDGISWSNRYIVNFNSIYQPYIWHFDVVYSNEIKNYMMFFYSDTYLKVYYAESINNNPLNFDLFTIPIINNQSWASNLYRPTFLYNQTGNDRIDIWYGEVNSSSFAYTRYVNLTYADMKSFLNKYFVNYTYDKLIDYKINENSGTTAYDSSGNGNNGTISGATWQNDGVLVSLIKDTDYTYIGNLFTLINSKYIWSNITLNYGLGNTLRGLYKLNEYSGNVLYDSRNNLSNGIKSGASWVSDGVLVQLPASNYSLDVNTGVFTLIGPYLYHYLTVIYETLSDKSAYNSIGVIENSGMTLVNYLPLVFLAIVFGAILFVVLKVIIPYLNLDKENKW